MEEINIKVQEIISEIDGIMLTNPKKALLRLEEFIHDKNKYDSNFLDEVKCKIAQTKGQLGDFEESEKILLRLQDKFQKSNNEKGLARIANELGNSYWARGNLNDSLKYYLRSLQLLEKMKDFSRMSVPLNNIGQIYWYNQEFDKARKSYNQSLKLAEEYQPEVVGDVLMNLGILSAEDADFAKAEEYYQQALAQYQEQNYTANIPIILVNLALLYEDTGQETRANEYHQKAIDSFRETGNRFGEMHALINYAGYNIKSGKLDNVLEILDKARLVAEEQKARTQMLQLYLHYRDYYKSVGDITKAYEYFEKYHDAEIDRLDLENREKLNDVLTKYETEKKEKEASLLRKQNELLAEKNAIIEEKSKSLNSANRKLHKANLELENRLEDILKKWDEQEILNRGRENLGGFSVILSNIAHQWKQPLNIIGLLMQNLVDAYEFDELNESRMEDFQNQVYRQIKYMSQIVNDFAFDLRDSVEEGYFSLQHALKLCEMLVEKTLEVDEITLINELEQDYQIIGNESQIIQVLIVILSNAVEIFQANTQENSLIKISAISTEENVTLEISDNGPLIPEDVLPEIFDQFFSTKDKKSNSGLGLTLAKKIIEEKFHGEIKCDNRSAWVVFSISLLLMKV